MAELNTDWNIVRVLAGITRQTQILAVTVMMKV
jgi:hypothetical protein